MAGKFLQCFASLSMLFNINLFAQDIVQTHKYPKGVFGYPLDLPPTTAGSFGELRSNHFHSGLDFKTNQQTGYPVHAVLDGYVSRLRIQFGGFGRAIYITHPNGFVSVYGHLEKLDPQLAKIVNDYQYKMQTWEADIKLTPLQFPVVKGQVVARSGNAGASAGPHLHFELRDAKTEETINPQLFGLTIKDNIAPTLTALYVYRLNGQPFSEKTEKQYFKVAGAAGKYHLLKPQIINLTDETGFGICAYDINSTSANHNGVYSIQLAVDEKLVYTFAVERFAFNETHAINAHIDYPAYVQSKREIQKSFILPGNKISVYPQSVNRGVVRFNDDNLHQVSYIVKDVMGNTSTLNITVKGNMAKPAVPVRTVGVLFKYNQKNVFTSDRVKVVIEPGNLYDDLLFTYATMPEKPGAFSPVCQIHNSFTPIHDSYELWIKPDTAIGKLAAKAVILSTYGVCEGGEYINGYIKANAHGFGDFYVAIDTVAPIIRPINLQDGSNLKSANKINIKIGDNLSGIKFFNGSIDGKWVLMEWDYKTKVLIYTFDDTVNPGKHIFSLAVSDNKNNMSQFTANFYR